MDFLSAWIVSPSALPFLCLIWGKRIKCHSGAIGTVTVAFSCTICVLAVQLSSGNSDFIEWRHTGSEQCMCCKCKSVKLTCLISYLSLNLVKPLFKIPGLLQYQRAHCSIHTQCASPFTFCFFSIRANRTARKSRRWTEHHHDYLLLLLFLRQIGNQQLRLIHSLLPGGQ